MLDRRPLGAPDYHGMRAGPQRPMEHEVKTALSRSFERDSETVTLARLLPRPDRFCRPRRLSYD